MATLKPRAGAFWVFLFLFATPAFAAHIPDDLFLEVYRGLMAPVCEAENGTEGTSADCQTVDPAVLQCWKDTLHMHYDEASMREFLEEIRQSNEKYRYYNEPYYNEFFSNWNWDNILKVTDVCG